MAAPRILVVGDVILDRYLHGRYTRPNPDGPGQVFLVDSIEEKPGGAGAVAILAAALGAEVTVIGAAGADQAQASLASLLAGPRFECHLAVSPDGRTTVKERRVAGGCLLLDRTDTEYPRPLGPQQEAFVVRWAQNGPWDAILVPDYGKGVVTPRVLDHLAREVGQSPLLIDPAPGIAWNRYPQAAILKANLAEARAATKSPVASPADLVAAWTRRFAAVVVTSGQEGLHLAVGRQVTFFPAITRPVIDCTGAGDTVLATIAVALASGDSLVQACQAACAAGAVQVGRLGVAPIDWQDIWETLSCMQNSLPLTPCSQN